MLGHLVLRETNEIIRNICGQFVCAILDGGTPHEDVWPVNTERKLYQNFPLSESSQTSWNQRFSVYLDGLLGELEDKFEDKTEYPET
jgi:hypothetical protein